VVGESAEKKVRENEGWFSVLPMDKARTQRGAVGLDVFQVWGAEPAAAATAAAAAATAAAAAAAATTPAKR